MMECTFQAGDKVTPIRGVWGAAIYDGSVVAMPPWAVTPEFGCIYTVREVYIYSGMLSMRLVEIHNPNDVGYHPAGFRRAYDTSVFDEILKKAPTPKQIPAEAEGR